MPVRTIDLIADWKVSFDNPNQNVPMAKFHSWGDDPELKFYSGHASYMKSFELSAADIRSRINAVLDFGAGTPVREPNPLPEHGMKAYLEAPVREAAEVYVNGQRAGYVWHPPYQLDVTRFLKAGKNDLRIVVGNTAINSLAGRSLPSYRLLNERYGQRFTPQDMETLQPLPSGLLGDLKLNLFRSSR